MKIVAISDTHTMHEQVQIPEGDVLCHAGDLTNNGELKTISGLNRWCGTLPMKHKLIIAGNHDFCFEDERQTLARKMITNFTYLQDEEVVIDGVKFWGTPWQPWFYDWAFNVEDQKLRAVLWDQIPDDTDVIIVHGPPWMHGDECVDGTRTGCRALADRIREIKPKYVICGHIHESYGTYKMGPTTVVNASVCTRSYHPTNKPIILEI